MRIFSSLSFFALSTFLLAAAPVPSSNFSPSIENLEAVQLTLIDETRLMVVLDQPEIELQTKYGLLSIPNTDICKVIFGHRVPEGYANKLPELIRLLGSEKYEVREQSQKDLLRVGFFAYPLLLKEAENKDIQISSKVKVLLRTIEAKYQNFKAPILDTIQTPTGNVSGTIKGTRLKFKTNFLGSQLIQIAFMREFIVAIKKELEVQASRSNWTDTKIDLGVGQTFQISASGEVDINPGQMTNHKSDPNGITNITGSDSFKAGALIARLGEEGPVFMVGTSKLVTNYKKVRLYLKVNHATYGSNPTGSYHVKIATSWGE